MTASTTTRDLKREAKMLKMAEAGVTYQAIGDSFGISRQRVHEILTRAGYDSRAEQLEAKYQRAVQQVIDAEGAISVRQAARESGISTSAITSRLIQKGYDPSKMREAYLEHRRMRRLQGKGSGTCRVCGVDKPWGEFAKAKKRGKLQRITRCKDCEKVRRASQ